MTDLLTEGNAAKLYCLDWIAHHAESNPALTILDLGSGRSLNFVRLLQRFPQVHYVGVEPAPAACEAARRSLAGLNATIHNAYAYDLYGQLLHEQFDIVVSFSVFEHVYRRLAYLQTARSLLKPDGFLLINYDSGHFRNPANLRERAKNLLGPLLARLGAERYYQSFVPEAAFQDMLHQVGLRVIEARSFNTHLKGVYKHIPEPDRPEYMRRWLEIELWLSERRITYDDSKANIWFTRNFILQPA
ncbi:MAG: methyltransferase [Anaerolineae bacterium]|nr:methyltransferase [Anaerolineae bacterium]